MLKWNFPNYACWLPSKLINECGFLQNNGEAPPLQKLKRRKQTSIQSRWSSFSSAQNETLHCFKPVVETACRNERRINKKWAQHKVSQTWCAHFLFAESHFLLFWCFAPRVGASRSGFFLSCVASLQSAGGSFDVFQQINLYSST